MNILTPRGMGNQKGGMQIFCQKMVGRSDPGGRCVTFS